MCDRRLAAYCLCFALCTILLVGCSARSFLPSSNDTIRSPWNSYEEVQNSFDRIIPYKTNLESLKEHGFAPSVTSNIQIMNHLDIMQRFLPNQSITLKNLDPGLQDCLAAQEHCQAFEIVLHKKDSDRYGNVILDLFNFRRKTMITGWEFRAIIVLKDELVVYKICGGKPAIDEAQDSKNPLGPLQSIGSFFWDVAR